MRPALLRLAIFLFCLICLSHDPSAQINTGLNGTVINLPCGQNCITQAFRIPHLKSSSDYTVNTVAYNPYQFVTPGGNEDLNIYNDDRYSLMFDLPFAFCFYDSLFTKVSVGSNGVITFDHGLLACNVATVAAAWDIAQIIPYNSNRGSCDGATSNYPKAAIMGVFQDLDPRPGPTFPNTNSSPPDRKIEWRVEGTAPFRRFVVSYYKIGVYQTTLCGFNTPTTFQIVIYESTGVIDIFVENKSCDAISTNGNRAILGIQNFNRDKGLAAPGKNAAPWTASNEGFRFVPSGPVSRFVRCELQTLTGALIVLGDTTTNTPGLLDVTFPNFCQAVPTEKYVIKSIYSACDNPAIEIVSYDTVTVNKTNALNATHTTTLTGCSVAGTGTATITVPPGIGTAPYTFVLNPGGTSFTGSSPHTFTNLSAGPYTILVTDASGSCSSSFPDTIRSTAVLTVTYNVSNTTCPGANNGQIVVNPPDAIPPITYAINGGTPTTNNIFSNLAPGNYWISTFAGGGCSKEFEIVPVLQGTSNVAGTAVPTNTSCSGVNDGKVTVTVTSMGAGPYQYSINNGASWQPGNVFTGLAPGSYNVLIQEAAVCLSNAIPVTITAGTGLQAGIAPSSTTCTGATNGSITVTMNPGSGTGPFTFVLDGTITQTSAAGTTTFNNIFAGPHNVTISDANGCTTSAPLTTTIAIGTGFNATFVPTPTGCAGANNGSLVITGQAPATAPLTVVLSPGAISQTSPTQTISFNNLAVGTYTAIVTDANGCQFNLNNMVVAAGAGLIGTPTPTATSCAGVSNGSISINMGSGAAPFTAIMDGTVTQTSATNIISFTGVAAGTHTITVTDANGCITSTPVSTTVSTGNGFTSTFVPTPTGCLGVNNGSIAITSQTPGTAPFTATLNPGAVTQTSATSTITFGSLSAGTYSAVVTDANGCQVALNNMTVTTGAGLIAVPTATGTSCAGVSNGSISINMGSGAPPFTAIMDGTVTQTSATNIISFTGVAAGTHTITVTDANGCITSTPVSTTVSTGNGFTSTFVPTPTGCLGVNNGSIAITSQAPGTAPFTATLNPGAVTQTSATSTITFGSLSAGTYSAVITDANGCQVTLNNMTVTTGAGLIAVPTATGTSCAGVNNGSISINMGSGAPPFTAIMDGTVTQTSATNIISFTGVAAGTHTITVTDANGCITSTPVSTTVSTGNGFTSTFVPTPTGCLGVNNGSIAITSQAPGTAPFTATLNPGAVTQTSATSTITFGSLSAGTYSAVITDANGCQVTLNNMTVTTGAGLIAVPTATGTSCAGVNNGSISINMGSGAPPYTAIMDGTATQTSSTNTILFAGVASGLHSITITDANGCVTSTPVATTVAAGIGFTVAFTPTATTCAGAGNGKLVLTPQTGGTAPFTAVLSPGGTTQTGSLTITFNNLTAGTYSAVITDANGCQVTLNNMNVAAGNLLNAIPTAVNTSCGGAGNGSINVQAPTNGTAPYLYSLNGSAPQSSPAFNAIAAGNYTINVTDAGGCSSGSLPATVNPGPPINVTPTKLDATCFGSATGSITAIASVNATAPIQYSLNNVTWQAGNIFNGLPANTYTVYIQDAVGCSNSAAVAIGQPSQLQATTSQQAVLCNSGNNGKIIVSGSGGTAPYSYSLDSVIFQSGGTFNVAAGNYSVFVRDANGCAIPRINVTVTEPSLLTATSLTSNASCGGNDGTISINSVGGVSPYQYALNGGTFQTGNKFNVGPGTYDINVKDVNGCTYPVNGIVVGLSNNLTFTPMIDPAAICEGKTVSLQLLSNATQFSWTNGASLSSSTIANPIAQPVIPTLYTVTATLGPCVITDDVFVPG